MPNPDRPKCYRCDKPAMLRRNLTSNGADQFGWYCVECEAWAVLNRPFISKWQAENIVRAFGKTLADLPSVGTDGNEPCRICGSKHTEVHHFAPQEYADKFDNWSAWAEITAPLCPKHHSQWHELVQGRKIR